MDTSNIHKAKNFNARIRKLISALEYETVYDAFNALKDEKIMDIGDGWSLQFSYQFHGFKVFGDHGVFFPCPVKGCEGYFGGGTYCASHNEAFKTAIGVPQGAEEKGLKIDPGSNKIQTGGSKDVTESVTKPDDLTWTDVTHNMINEVYKILADGAPFEYNCPRMRVEFLKLMWARGSVGLHDSTKTINLILKESMQMYYKYDRKYRPGCDNIPLHKRLVQEGETVKYAGYCQKCINKITLKRMQKVNIGEVMSAQYGLQSDSRFIGRFMP